MRRILVLALVLLVGIGGLGAADAADAADAAGTSASPRWDAATVDALSRLPVQDEGRIKPLDTVASYLLLRCNGRRSVRLDDGTRLDHMQWALDALLRTGVADGYRIFQVQTDEVLDAIGLDHEGRKKRDRYSFAELQPAMHRLFQLADDYGSLEEDERGVVQDQVILLAQNVADYHRFSRAFELARARLERPATPGMRSLFPRDEALRPSQVLERAAVIVAAAYSLAYDQGSGSEEARARELKAIDGLFQDLARAAQPSAGLTWLPPPEPKAEQWWHAAELADQAVHAEDRKRLIALVDALERAEDLAAADPATPAAANAAEALRAHVAGLAQDRGEAGKIGLEVAYHRADFFYRSLLVFLAAVLCACWSWLRPRSRAAIAGTWSLSAVAVAVLVTGIVVRCVLRERPPVSTLYETILFITAVATLSGMAVEWVTRQRVALSVLPFLGAGGMFLATAYETGEARDTLPQLIAVLDTNFWLSTHVTTITMGYAAGLLAAALAHVHLLGRTLGLRRGDHAYYRGIARMVYGTLCFSLLFSTVGTILGGVWANESWGRFWGWDPKENGALLIVLWQLIIVHARVGGLVRDDGTSALAIVGGAVIAFSWWGVNELGVGLHSYGQTSGVMLGLMVFYAIEALVLVAAALLRLRARRALSAG